MSPAFVLPHDQGPLSPPESSHLEVGISTFMAAVTPAAVQHQTLYMYFICVVVWVFVLFVCPVPVA